jgi:hypothetical protein
MLVQSSRSTHAKRRTLKEVNQWGQSAESSRTRNIY